MKTVQDHTFSHNPIVKGPRSVFNRPFKYKTGMQIGQIIPFYWDEAYPGDSFKGHTKALVRINTLLHPLMDNLEAAIEYWAVPNRIIWENWRKFNGEQETPGDSIDYTVPKVNVTVGVAEDSLLDKLGVPIGLSGNDLSALAYRAYYCITDHWYRDQNLSNDVGLAITDADTTTTDGGTLVTRVKRPDYFTTCLPWPQKGDAVELPLGSTAPVSSTGTGIPTFDGSVAGTNEKLYTTNSLTEVKAGASAATVNGDLSWNTTNLVADLTTATASNINQIREAFQIQKLLEKDARGGTRYPEIIYNHFAGVVFNDITYRPEYLGGGVIPVNVEIIPSTSNATGAELADLGAFGTAFGDAGFVKSFNEHCIVMGFITLRQTDQTYSQGVRREFLRNTRYDYYLPVLAHLGEQAVTNAEIYWQGTSADDDVFGYNERWSELRYYPSKATGVMSPLAATPLDSWHLGIEFSSLPTLGDTFIKESEAMLERAIATPSEPHAILDSYTELKCARLMPLYSIPGMVDHF